ncbi:MAG TPA: hypothetical protein VIK39_08780 [Candidatus Angelobacter sp.]
MLYTSVSHMDPATTPTPTKSLRGALVRVLALVALFGVLLLGSDAVFTPWAFLMGGHFHINPKWTGWGRMHSNTAGDYVIYMSISPYFGRGRSLTDITGKGAICTQRGDNYPLNVGGSFQSHPGIDLQGKTAVIYAHNYSKSHYDPSLEFRGKWNNPDLVLDDQGSINRAFDPGGTLAPKTHMRPDVHEVVPLTLHEGSRSDFEAACAEMKR